MKKESWGNKRQTPSANMMLMLFLSFPFPVPAGYLQHFVAQVSFGIYARFGNGTWLNIY